MTKNDLLDKDVYLINYYYTILYDMIKIGSNHGEYGLNWDAYIRPHEKDRVYLVGVRNFPTNTVDLRKDGNL